ncbi:MAG: tannase/feruloyl esterase family alpha/beta hydrolase [Bryobacteraceae bacterium]
MTFQWLPLLVVSAAAAAQQAPAECAALVHIALPGARISAAEPHAGSFTPPGAKPMLNLPAFCRVTGTIRPTPDSDIRFEIWLPAEWNGKFQGVGNGGFAGAISYGGLAGAIRHGYAAASTDTGHQAGGIDARWALGHPEKIADYGWRAIHEMTVAAKAIVKAHYGKPASKSYFSSCSNGGRQALMEAQRFPEDYDGIIAGAPANYITRLLALMITMEKALAAPGAHIPPAKLPAIQMASLAACDTRDGVADGVVENPAGCRPDYSTLACSGAENDTCLTRPQLDALRTITGGLVDRHGKRLFPPVSFGGESEQGGWLAWITGPRLEQSAAFGFGTQFFKNMVYSDPDWDYRKFDLDRDMAAAKKKMGPVLDAVDPDLSRFERRGGKLILYHGWCDAAIPAENTINYYRSVEKKMGSKKTLGFVRLFLAPGVQHCGGGAGPSSFGQGGPSGREPENDLNAALEQWVEHGSAPERVIAAKVEQGVTVRTRPLCAYPAVAAWKGAGSTDDAANFECK